MSDGATAEGNGNGSGRRRRRRGGGGGGRDSVRLTDLWRPVAPLADPEPIVPAPDPTALIRSLGTPPLHGQGATAEHYLAAVIEKAANLARALAMSADLLAPDGDD